VQSNKDVTMKRDAHLPVIGHRLSAPVITAMLTCFLAFGVSDALASATTAAPPTRAQKLTKALKVCKKQPKRKRAACVKRAKKKYGPLQSQHPSAVTQPAPSAAAPASAPATGPTSPAAPTSAQIEALVCSFHCPIVSFTILERGVPRLGSGVSTQRGGDGVPSDTWIFPLLVSYDKTESAHRFGPPEEQYTLTRHTRERTNAQIDAAGALRIWVQAVTETCEPALVNCGISFGGGA
jgi:hypothetical protein